MWMCLKSEDKWSRCADISFGGDAEEAFKNYLGNHDSDADPDDMLFYELGSPHTATVTWTLVKI